eukprot:gene16585-biopygen3315
MLPASSFPGFLPVLERRPPLFVLARRGPDRHRGVREDAAGLRRAWEVPRPVPLYRRPQVAGKSAGQREWLRMGVRGIPGSQVVIHVPGELVPASDVALRSAPPRLR